MENNENTNPLVMYIYRLRKSGDIGYDWWCIMCCPEKKVYILRYNAVLFAKGYCLGSVFGDLDFLRPTPAHRQYLHK